MKKLFGLILFSLFFSLSVLSLDAQEHTYSDQTSTSQEILNIADAIVTIADRMDNEHQSSLDQLTEDLKESRTESVELRFTLDRMQQSYANLHSDYGSLQVTLKRWKTISLILGVTSVISVGTTILILAIN